MRKNLIFLVAMLTTMAFAGSVMAQGQAKPAAPAATEKQAPAPEKQKATESNEERGRQSHEASGSVATYEAGKMIKIKEKDKELSFDLTGSTMVKGEVKDGAKVTVMYKKEGEKMVATAITMTPAKKS